MVGTALRDAAARAKSGDAVAYGAAKLAGEQLAKALAAVGGTRTSFAILRIGWCQPGANRPGTLSAAGVPPEFQNAGGGGGGAASADVDEAWFKNMWLSNGDFLRYFESALDAPVAPHRGPRRQALVLVPAPVLAQQAPALVPAPVPAAAAAVAVAPPQLQVQAPERQVPARGRRGAGAPGVRRRRRRRRGGGGDPGVVARGALSRRRPRRGSTAPALGLTQLGSAGRCQVRSFCRRALARRLWLHLCDRCGSGEVDVSTLCAIDARSKIS